MARQTTQVDDTNVTFQNLGDFVEQNIEAHPVETADKVLELYGPSLKDPYETRRYKATSAAIMMIAYVVKRVAALEAKLEAAPKVRKVKKAKRLGDRLKTSKRTASASVMDDE